MSASRRAVGMSARRRLPAPNRGVAISSPIRRPSPRRGRVFPTSLPGRPIAQTGTVSRLPRNSDTNAPVDTDTGTQVTQSPRQIFRDATRKSGNGTGGLTKLKVSGSDDRPVPSGRGSSVVSLASSRRRFLGSASGMFPAFREGEEVDTSDANSRRPTGRRGSAFAGVTGRRTGSISAVPASVATPPRVTGAPFTLTPTRTEWATGASPVGSGEPRPFTLVDAPDRFVPHRHR
jgi:hypothetical protein